MSNEKDTLKDMRKLVLTIAIGDDYQGIARLTHASIRAYARKIGADFICIDRKKISQTTPHWEKFQIYKLLNRYDRILYIDTDIIIREDCPDLFDRVPEDRLGMFNEAPFTDRSKELLIDICRQYEVTLEGWNGKYYNSGVMVISRCHRGLFRKPENEIFSFYEQSYLNMMIAKQGIVMQDLHYRFNRMTCIDRFTGEDRHNSYIIHYAGYPSLRFLLNLIPQDIERWKRDKKNRYRYRRHIYVSVTGGLGDQICAEPAVRFMREHLYPDDEMVVATHSPRIFAHLQKSGVEIIEHGKANLKMDTPYYIGESLPGPDRVQWSIVSHLLCHTVDYASMALMHRMLPLKERQVRFEPDQQEFDSLFKAAGKRDLKDCVVVHPGRHWDTKTFPTEYWQEIVNGLIDNGLELIVIGKDEQGDPPDFKAGARGTVDIEIKNSMIDLRNKLSLGELGALLSLARLLVTNDSAPVHLAGAFDNWIVLLPSCKHEDHILPYRNGTQLYKTVALRKKLIIDEVESRPTQIYPTSIDIKVNDWNEYLTEPGKVIDKVVELLSENQG